MKKIKQQLQMQRLIIIFKLKHYFKSHLFGLSGIIHLVSKLVLIISVYTAYVLLVANMFIEPQNIIVNLIKIVLIVCGFNIFNNYQDGDYSHKSNFSTHDIIIYLIGVVHAITIGIGGINQLLVYTALLMFSRIASIILDKHTKIKFFDFGFIGIHIYLFVTYILNYSSDKIIFLIILTLSSLNLANKLLLLHRKTKFEKEYGDQFEFNIVDVYDEKFSYENSNVFCYEPNQSGRLISLYFDEILTAYNRDITYLSLEPDNNKTMVLVPIRYFESKKPIFLMLTGKDFALQVEIIGSMYSDNPYISSFKVSNFSKIKETQELNEKEIKDIFNWLKKCEKKVNKKTLYRNMHELNIYFLRAINDYNIVQKNIALDNENISIIMGDKGKSVCVLAALANKQKSTKVFSLYFSNNILKDLYNDNTKFSVYQIVSLIGGFLITSLGINGLYTMLNYYTNKQSSVSYLEATKIFNVTSFMKYSIVVFIIALIVSVIIYKLLYDKKIKSNEYQSQLKMLNKIDNYLIKNDTFYVLEDLELAEQKEMIYQFLSLVRAHSICKNRYIVIGNDELKITKFGKIIAVDKSFSLSHHAKMLKELKIVTDEVEDYLKIESV